MRVTWNAPEGRFFDTGLDRGMLYPKGTPPLGPILATNTALNPSALGHNNVFTERLRNWCTNPSFGTNINEWLATDAGAVLSRDTVNKETGAACMKMVLSGAQGNQGAYYNPVAIAALTPGDKFGTMVRVKGPVGLNMDLYAISQPDGPGTRVQTFTCTGAWQWVVARDAVLAVNENPYIVIRTRNDSTVPATVYVDRAMIYVAQDAPSWFDGDSPDVNGVRYSWVGTAHASHSILETTLVDWWVSQGPLLRFEDDDYGWVEVDANRWVYAVATGVVGRYYGYRMTITGPAGTIVTPQSTDNVVGGVGESVAQTIPASGVLELEVRSYVNAVAGTSLNVGYTANRRTRASKVVVAEVKGPGLLPSADALRFFDGDSESGAYTFAWVGTPRASSSTKREVLTYAVPWGGLVSVDEEGGDGASSYYIDGRPFLFLPKPKEYKATLKAYTYPDEFSDIMGVTEVADGMYLDSQPGKAFDLCYRTMVGNAHDGVDHGYKLHLVYNATVTPQALTYESLSNSINPTTFSWEIQAVPVRVEGFRPTAHIIIDTRHMDPTKIAAIEALVYGAEDDIPHMPSPQVIFDLLSFGDTITVIDNGDGTFDVVGSYENVYMVGPGVFRVDNVDGQDNGDGTFTISTTTA